MPAVDPHRPLRVAVAGFGQAGGCHVQTWARVPGATIVGVYSLRPDVEGDRHRRYVRERRASVLSNYCRMLDETGATSFRSTPARHHAAEDDRGGGAR